MKEEYVKVRDLEKAIENWQNTVGAGLNGQLETYLGMTLGALGSFVQARGHALVMEQGQANRVRLLLSDNHATMIKVYLAKQK